MAKGGAHCKIRDVVTLRGALRLPTGRPFPPMTGNMEALKKANVAKRYSVNKGGPHRKYDIETRPNPDKRTKHSPTMPVYRPKAVQP